MLEGKKDKHFYNKLQGTPAIFRVTCIVSNFLHILQNIL